MEISLCLSAYDDMNPTAIDAARFWGDGRTPDAARPLRRTRPARLRVARADVRRGA